MEKRDHDTFNVRIQLLAISIRTESALDGKEAEYVARFHVGTCLISTHSSSLVQIPTWRKLVQTVNDATCFYVGTCSLPIVTPTHQYWGELVLGDELVLGGESDVGATTFHVWAQFLFIIIDSYRSHIRRREARVCDAFPYRGSLFVL